MIEAINVSKSFNGVTVLDKVNFSVEKGEIVGFLGCNGAGKTTLMRILTTYLKPTVGCAKIAGYDVNKSPGHIKRIIGYLPENPPLYENMNVFDYLRFCAELKDVERKNVLPSIDRVLAECNLREVKSRNIGILSKGYKQRVGIAQAIIHQPQLLILDEPTNGLDPIQVEQVRSLIKSLEDRTTVILSTHILSEIEQLAKRVLIIKKGKIITDNSMDELLRSASSQGKPSLEKVFIQANQDNE